MTREKDFDEAATVIEIMHLFRRQGYEATSIKDIEQVTGLKAGSLYHAFGSKHGMLMRALDHYVSEVILRRIATYLTGDDPLADLRALFVSTFVHQLGDERGCLLTNCSVELGAQDSASQRLMLTGLSTLERKFEQLAARGQTLGSVRTDLTPASLGRHLLLSYQGLLVLLKVNTDKNALHQYVETTLDMIRAPAAAPEPKKRTRKTLEKNN